MIYGIFLFIVAVVMLNLLIAQFSKSYEEVTESARVSVTQNRAKILTTLQSSLWLQLIYVRFRTHKHLPLLYNFLKCLYRTLVQPCRNEKEYIRDLLYYRYQESSPFKTSSHGRLHVYVFVAQEALRSKAPLVEYIPYPLRISGQYLYSSGSSSTSWGIYILPRKSRSLPGEYIYPPGSQLTSKSYLPLTPPYGTQIVRNKWRLELVDNKINQP